MRRFERLAAAGAGAVAGFVLGAVAASTEVVRHAGDVDEAEQKIRARCAELNVDPTVIVARWREELGRLLVETPDEFRLCLDAATAQTMRGLNIRAAGMTGEEAAEAFGNVARLVGRRIEQP